ncbi:hypothetical protein BDK51DRAFT_28524 [Blyttiomyces helicus]|uniref:Uncharacterized protein n=1 Tax=Blyttiomyces helicus TaxID=388810 RepID=A0A4P9WJY4_9FUNG|nr:hypothetical protein BDK51DRAFT_28524 [Blyttiomyces helicus]|eukprot:RKO91848.1 hypothetical protein BDK51DRAFT_28524 [Blyttiomyces helicus]
MASQNVRFPSKEEEVQQKELLTGCCSFHFDEPRSVTLNADYESKLGNGHMIIVLYKMGNSKLEIYKIGVEAKDAVEAVVDSLPTQVKGRIATSTSSLEHPASLSRKSSNRTNTQPTHHKDITRASTICEEVQDWQQRGHPIARVAVPLGQQLTANSELDGLCKPYVASKLGRLLKTYPLHALFQRYKTKVEMQKSNFDNNRGYSTRPTGWNNKDEVKTHMQIQLESISSATRDCKNTHTIVTDRLMNYMEDNPAISENGQVSQFLEYLSAYEVSFENSMTMLQASILSFSQASRNIGIGAAKVRESLQRCEEALLEEEAEPEQRTSRNREHSLDKSVMQTLLRARQQTSVKTIQSKSQAKKGKATAPWVSPKPQQEAEKQTEKGHDITTISPQVYTPVSQTPQGKKLRPSRAEDGLNKSTKASATVVESYGFTDSDFLKLPEGQDPLMAFLKAARK